MPEATKRRNTHNVTIDESVYLTLQAEERTKAVAEFRKESTVGYVNKLLKYLLAKRELAKEMAPHLNLEGVGTQSVLVRDTQLNKNVGIFWKDKEPYCDTCKKSNCIHVEYAKMFPEFGHLGLVRQQ